MSHNPKKNEMSVAVWETLLQNCTVGARVQVGDHIVAMVPRQPEALESMPASYREVVIVFDPRSEVTERQVTCDRRTRLQVLRACARTFVPFASRIGRTRFTTAALS